MPTVREEPISKKGVVTDEIADQTADKIEMKVRQESLAGGGGGTISGGAYAGAGGSKQKKEGAWAKFKKEMIDILSPKKIWGDFKNLFK